MANKKIGAKDLLAPWKKEQEDPFAIKTPLKAPVESSVSTSKNTQPKKNTTTKQNKTPKQTEPKAQNQPEQTTVAQELLNPGKQREQPAKVFESSVLTRQKQEMRNRFVPRPRHPSAATAGISEEQKERNATAAVPNQMQKPEGTTTQAGMTGATRGDYNPFGAYRVTSAMGPRNTGIKGASTNHRGTDYAVPYGTAVPSPVTGEVIETGFNNARGYYVRVRDQNGYVHTMQHLSKIMAKEGQQVKASDVVAASGNSGVGSGAHMHYEITAPDGSARDARTFFSGGGAGTLPVIYDGKTDAPKKQSIVDTSAVKDTLTGAWDYIKGLGSNGLAAFDNYRKIFTPNTGIVQKEGQKGFQSAVRQGANSLKEALFLPEEYRGTAAIEKWNERQEQEAQKNEQKRIDTLRQYNTQTPQQEDFLYYSGKGMQSGDNVIQDAVRDREKTAELFSPVGPDGKPQISMDIETRLQMFPESVYIDPQTLEPTAAVQNTKNVKYLYTTPQERMIYAYELGKNGKDAAEAYLNTLERDLDRRRAEAEAKYVQKKSDEHPILTGVPTNTSVYFKQPLTLLETGRQMAANIITGEPMPVNQYSPLMQGPRLYDASMEGITADMSDTAASATRYGLGTANQLIGMIPGFLIGNPTIFNAASAAGRANYDAVQRGATPEEALAYSTAVGGIYKALNIVPANNLKQLLLQPAKTAPQFAKYVAASMGLEAASGLVSTVAEKTADNIIMRDKSEYEIMKQYLQDEAGLSEEEATKQAFWEYYMKDAAAQMAGDAVFGGISAAGAIGLGTARNTFRMRAADGASGKVYMQAGLVDDIINTGESFDSNTAAYKAAKKLGDKYFDGEKVRYADVGKQVRLNEAQFAELERQNALRTFQDTEQKRVQALLGQPVTTPLYKEVLKPTLKQRTLIQEMKNNGISVTFVEPDSALLAHTGQEINGANVGGHNFISTTAENPARVVAAHEFTHQLKNQNTRAFAELEQLAKKRLGTNTVSEELVADIVGDVMSQPEAYRKTFQQNTQIMDKLFDFLGTFRKQDGTNVSGVAKEFKGLQDKIGAILQRGMQAEDAGAAGTPEVRYQIKWDAENKPYVLVEDDIFAGHEGEKPHKVIRDFLKQHVGEAATILESGQKVYLGKDLPGEYVHSKGTYKLTKENLDAKNQAAQNLPELIEIASDKRWIKNKKEKHAIDAKYGWYKYATRFQIGADMYKADLLIRNADNGKKYLYDILGVKKEPSSSTANHYNNETVVNRMNSFFNTSIPQKGTDVNIYDMQNGENDASKVKYSISYDRDNKPYVVIERDIFAGHEGEKPHKVIRDFLKQHVGEAATILESGQKVYLGKDLPGEYTQSKSAVKNPVEIKKAKGQAAQNLGELIEIGTDRRWIKNKKEKHDIDAKYGWYKYVTRFQIGDAVYNADLLIRNDADGKKYLYDIQGIKKETNPRRGTILKDAPQQRNLAVPEDGFIDITIPQKGTDVNTYDMQNGENDAGNGNVKYSIKRGTDGKKTALDLFRGVSVVDNSDGWMKMMRTPVGNGQYKYKLDWERPDFRKLQETPEYKQLLGRLSEKKDLLNPRYQTNDIWRIFRDVFGKDYPTAKKLFLDPLDDSKKAYAFIEKFYTDILKNRVVDGLGIKKGSKLSELVQKYGEKKLTKEELQNISDTDMEKIREADGIFRWMYDSLIDTINDTRRIIYPTAERFASEKEQQINKVREHINLLELATMTGDFSDVQGAKTDQRKITRLNMGVKNREQLAKNISKNAQDVLNQLDEKIAEKEGEIAGKKRKDTKTYAKLQNQLDKLKLRREGIEQFRDQEQLINNKQLQSLQALLEENTLGFESKIKNRLEKLRSREKTLTDELNSAENRKLIPKRKDYYRHFQELSGGFREALENLGRGRGLPNSMAGISEWTKPKAKWMSAAQQRTLEDNTKYDAVGGFLDYLPGAAYAAAIDPNITVFRGLEQDARSIIGETKTDDGKTIINKSNISGFLKFLDNYANDLAGKTNAFDRAWRDTMPEAFQAVHAVAGRVKSNAILMNVSSAMAQGLNVPNAIGYIRDPRALVPAVMDLMSGAVQGSDARKRYKQSSFLAERFSDVYSQFDTKLFQQPKKFALWMLGALDEAGTRYIWDAAYRKGEIDGAKSPARYADDVTRRMVAGRGIGEMPLWQKSKLLSDIAPFTLEVGNMWRVQRDIITEQANKVKDALAGDTVKMLPEGEPDGERPRFRMRKENKYAKAASAAGGAVAGLMMLYASSFIANSIVKQLRGSGGSFDPIGALMEGETVPEKLGNLAGEVLGATSMGQAAAALYPEYGIELPGTDIRTPARAELFGENDPTRYGTGGIFNLIEGGLEKPLTSFVTPWGGSQIDKTIKGIKGLMEEGVYTKNGQLKYPVERNAENTVKGLLFGRSGFQENSRYYDEELSPLSENQTEEYKNAEDGHQYWEDILQERIKNREEQDQRPDGVRVEMDGATYVLPEGLGAEYEAYLEEKEETCKKVLRSGEYTIKQLFGKNIKVKVQKLYKDMTPEEQKNAEAYIRRKNISEEEKEQAIRDLKENRRKLSKTVDISETNYDELSEEIREKVDGKIRELVRKKAKEKYADRIVAEAIDVW